MLNAARNRAPTAPIVKHGIRSVNSDPRSFALHKATRRCGETDHKPKITEKCPVPGKVARKYPIFAFVANFQDNQLNDEAR
jgi:hypothetical protein